MEYQKESNGWQTFGEYWGFIIPIPVLVLAIVASTLAMPVAGATSIHFVTANFALMIPGAVLICYAKLTAYRAGKFLTFGERSVPRVRRGYYRWGWCLFLLGVLINLILIFSSP